MTTYPTVRAGAICLLLVCVQAHSDPSENMKLQPEKPERLVNAKAEKLPNHGCDMGGDDFEGSWTLYDYPIGSTTISAITGSLTIKRHGSDMDKFRVESSSSNHQYDPIFTLSCLANGQLALQGTYTENGCTHHVQIVVTGDNGLTIGNCRLFEEAEKQRNCEESGQSGFDRNIDIFSWHGKFCKNHHGNQPLHPGVAHGGGTGDEG